MIILTPLEDMTIEQIKEELAAFLASKNLEMTPAEQSRSKADLNQLLITAKYFEKSFFLMSKHLGFFYTTLKKKEVIKPGLTVLKNANKRARASRIVPDCLKKYYS